MGSDGILSIVQSGPAQVGDSVRDLSAYEEDIILALEPALLTRDTELELRRAAAIRREGEPNEIYRHMVHSITGSDGGTAAYIGITYEAAGTAPGTTGIIFFFYSAVPVFWFTGLACRSG